MTLDRAIEALTQSRRDMLAAVAGLEDPHFGEAPAGAWSASQIVQHVARGEQGTIRGLRLVAAGKHRIEDRWDDPFRRLAWRLRLDRFVRVRAAQALSPEQSLPRAETLAMSDAVRSELLAMLTGPDAAQLVAARFRHFVFGPFPMPQFVHFLSEHEQRHRRQVDRLRATLGR